MEPRVQYATAADGVSIAFWTVGEGMPVLQMPPIPWSHIQLEWQDPDYRRWHEALARGRRLIRYDCRGSGLSQRDAAGISLESMALDVDAVTDRLGLDSFALVGVCFSAPVAIAYAAAHPDRVSQLLLWCGYARDGDIRTEQMTALTGLEERDWDLFVLTAAHALVAGWTASDQAQRFAGIMRESVTREGFQKVRDAFTDSDVSHLLPKVATPTLVLHRRQAPFPPAAVAQELASRIPNAQMALLEGASLLPFVGNLDEAVAAIDSFLGPRPPAAVEPVRREEGGGLVTILFTDVENSTALTRRLGDAAAREVLREHERIVREALRAHGGSEVKTMGDGFMASFASASRAIECAISLQEAFARHNQSAGEPVLVRVGINAGEPIAEEKDLFGTVVIAAERICGRAAGGEVLAADVVRQLVAGKGFLFSDRGESVLRGFEDPVRLYEVRWREQS